MVFRAALVRRDYPELMAYREIKVPLASELRAPKGFKGQVGQEALMTG